MTTPPADSDAPVAHTQTPSREAAECEAGLQRILAYICARRHRRLIAFAGVFLLIYTVVGFLISIVSPAATGLILVNIHSRIAPVNPEIYPLVFSLTRIAPSLLITLLIFMRLRKIYLSYAHPDSSSKSPP